MNERFNRKAEGVPDDPAISPRRRRRLAVKAFGTLRQLTSVGGDTTGVPDEIRELWDEVPQDGKDQVTALMRQYERLEP